MCYSAPVRQAPPDAVSLPQQDRDYVGGRLKDHYRQWRQVGNKTVRRWVREGVKFDFTHDPPAPRSAYDSADLILDPVRFQATRETVLKYKRIGALELVPQSERGKGTYLTFFQWRRKLRASGAAASMLVR